MTQALWVLCLLLLAAGYIAAPSGPVLAAGLGNRAMTCDAVGPASIDNLLVTRHMIRAMPRQFADFRPVAAVCPGVLARTGLEALELVRGAVERVRPAAVIAVDALAARDSARLCATVQLSDTGLVPGSGVGNRRSALDRGTLGVPVIAVGIPTVVDADLIAVVEHGRITEQGGYEELMTKKGRFYDLKILQK